VAGLLERDDELARLAGAVEGAIAGRGSFVLIGGEAGIGKTSLVRALRDRVGGRVSFLSGACEPLSVPAPLGPLRELFEAAGGGELLELGSDDRLVMARALRDALVERAPLVAVIEDVHWADPLTLDLILILARRIEGLSVVVVVTYRDDELEAHPELRLLLGDLNSAPAVARIALRPLSESAVRRLASAQGIDALDLLRATGGNPFLVVESIAADGRLPASVRDAALARVGRLGLDAREALDAAAVIGPRFDPALVEVVLSADVTALEEACARGVLVADGSALAFRHELIREAIESSISPQRRSALHARAFAALAARSRAEDHARLAHHAELGGLTVQAARHARIAAGEAERVGALRETYLQADRALRLGGALDRVDRFELLVQCSRASNFANPRLKDAVDAAERAVALAQELHDERRRGRALMVLSYALWSLERVVEARAAAEQAIAAFEPTDDAASLAWAYATLIRIDATAFDPNSAIELAPRALGLAEEARLEEVRIDVAVSLGLAHGHRGEREALEILGDAVTAAKEGGFTIRMVRAYVNLTTVAVALREHERVDLIAAEALPLLEERNVSALPIMAIRFFRARSLLDRGRFDEALALAARRERWWQGEFPVACALEGLIKARRGQPGAADLLVGAWQEITARVAAEGSRHGMIRLALVEAAWLRGERAAALAELRDASESPAVARFARSGGELALWAARLGTELELPAGVPEPVLRELEGDWRGAIAAWRALQAPYEAALAALPGDDRAAREALVTLHKLGARAAAKAFARERAARGARRARGPRRSTLANAAGLTRREQEVLEGLATGASNAAIAAKLYVSQRTIGHHVSAILRKLDAPNRMVAVELARAGGLLPEVRHRTPSR
jgi:DNA-binding CsgD family transcriptional regulator/tetratricopeptide (TPR) repeat protein